MAQIHANQDLCHMLATVQRKSSFCSTEQLHQLKSAQSDIKQLCIDLFCKGTNIWKILLQYNNVKYEMHLIINQLSKVSLSAATKQTFPNTCLVQKICTIYYPLLCQPPPSPGATGLPFLPGSLTPVATVPYTLSPYQLPVFPDVTHFSLSTD